MRDRLEPIWPSNKKLSRLKLKTERVELTPEGLANSLPAHDALSSEKRNGLGTRRRTRALYDFESNKDYRETGRRIRLTSSPRLISYLLLCKKRREHSWIVASDAYVHTVYTFRLTRASAKPEFGL